MVGVGQWEGANSGPLSQFGKNQGPWFDGPAGGCQPLVLG